MNRGVRGRHDLDPALLWLWLWWTAVALIWPLAWEPPNAKGEALKKKRAKKFFLNENNTGTCRKTCSPLMPLCLVNSPSAITMKGVFVTVIVQVYFFSMSNVILLFFNLKMSHCYKNTLVSKLHWHSSLVWKRLLILCLSFLDNVHNKNSFGEANDHELSSTWLAKDKKGFFSF